MRCTDERVQNDVVILTIEVQGLGDVSTGLTDRVRSLVADGRRRFVLNLSGVAGLDSHGLGDLVASQQAAATAGARMALCHVHPYVAEPLEIMNVDALFDIFDSEQAAVQSFA